MNYGEKRFKRDFKDYKCIKLYELLKGLPDYLVIKTGKKHKVLGNIKLVEVKFRAKRLNMCTSFLTKEQIEWFNKHPESVIAFYGRLKKWKFYGFNKGNLKEIK